MALGCYVSQRESARDLGLYARVVGIAYVDAYSITWFAYSESMFQSFLPILPLNLHSWPIYIPPYTSPPRRDANSSAQTMSPLSLRKNFELREAA